MEKLTLIIYSNELETFFPNKKVEKKVLLFFMFSSILFFTFFILRTEKTF